MLPLNQQHPIRGSFLDPRPDRQRGAIYHEGIDVAVRDDRPERGAPRGRTHRVYAIEGGRVHEATARRPGLRADRPLRLRPHRDDGRGRRGRARRPADRLDVAGSWHVHLSEFVFTVDGRRLIVNPLRRGGKIFPYVDRVKPVVHDIRFYAPATPRWGRRPANVALLPQAGRRLNRARLSGKVDIRVRASDPQSFIGWFKQIPHLAAPHHPFRMAVTIVQVATRKVVHRRDVFWAEQMLEMPAGQHFAPGTEQNLPANGCMLFHRTVACDGTYWFRLFPARTGTRRDWPTGATSSASGSGTPPAT